MYLKSIKAYGFKSFADKTEINFEKNINGIVGPNGSGKSNVVDAVRWVLGEQSVKSLRGEQSVDVIFSGSKSRKPLNSASVTLVFDNTDRHLPIDYSEVSVKRVMYRTGENEYYLNNERSRLKDITNILTDSGADKEAFNIISQGKIDEILSTKASDRRVIFESAAGVLKYKKRKVEALKKLDRTTTNIDRVNDIISELESRITPLKKQSEVAKTYLEYKDKLKNIEISLIAFDLNNYDYDIKNMKKKLDTINDELAELSSNNASYDIDILKMKDKVKDYEITLNEKQNLLVKLSEDIQKIDANMRIFKERQKYVQESNNTLDNIMNIKEKILKIDNDINGINLINNSLIKEIELDNNKKNDINNNIIIKKKERDNISNQYNSNIKELTNLKYKIDYLENNINKNGLPNAIKNIMNNPRLEGIHNIVGKLIDIPPEYNLCIGTSLGGSTNYLVVDNSSIAKDLVKYLKSNNYGRATFYPIDVIKPRFIDNNIIDMIKDIYGYIGIASDLVKYDSIYDNIIKNLLGNVIICQDLDSANDVSKMINNRYKIVSLDGQVINVGGSITGGSTIWNNNIIKDKYELDNSKVKYEELNNNNINMDIKIKDINNIIKEEEDKIYEIEYELELKISKRDKYNSNIEELEKEKSNLNRELIDLTAISNDNSDKELDNLLNTYYSAINNRDTLVKEIEELKKEKDNLNNNLIEIDNLSKQSNNYIKALEKDANKIEIDLNMKNMQMDNLLKTLTEEYNMTYDYATNNYKLEIDVEEARSIVKDYKTKLKDIDSVNIDAINEYEEVSARYKFLTKQKDDLNQAYDTLLEIIDDMDSVMKSKFLSTFEEIRVEFKRVFRELFKGGEAELVLTDPDNILETGIDIEAVPSGKKLKSLSLLSGGEKTFTAISLLFAILNVRPVPFCILDEVEAALDDANVESFGNYLNKYKDKTQFILITHKKKTMEFADILYGITMQESGVSKLVSVRLEEIK